MWPTKWAHGCLVAELRIALSCTIFRSDFRRSDTLATMLMLRPTCVARTACKSFGQEHLDPLVLPGAAQDSVWHM